jgi:two-component system LytT family response regulator
LNVVIVEDEPLAREKLAGCLRAAAPHAAIAAELASVSEAVRWFRSNPPPDLVFCDIQLTDGLSFEIFRAVPFASPVVFTTAHDEYMLEAFQSNGIDYLLKPIRQAQVAAALAKFEALAGHFSSEYAARLRNVTHGGAKRRDRFLIRRGAGFHVVKTSDIAYCFTEDKLVFLVTRDGKRHLIEKVLSEIEREIGSDRFFRANRAWLISIDAVERCTAFGKGRLALELAPPAKEAVVVSQERAAACRIWLGE